MKYDIYDLAILGCGPAGLSAAVNATIRNRRAIVIGAEICSPPLHKAQMINNYLGVPGQSGEELLESFMDHVLKMDIEVLNTKAEAINELKGKYQVLAGDQVITSWTVVVATGIPYRQTLPREDFFLGKGLGYCATCDGPIYKDKDVLIIGHSPEAEAEANFMNEICRRVYYIALYKTQPRLDQGIIIVDSRPDRIVGRDFVEGLQLQDGRTINVEGLFVLGAETAPDRLIPGLELADNHIRVNRNQETNLPGVFAAGDCTGPPYQIAKSVGEGQVAGLNAARYASEKAAQT